MGPVPSRSWGSGQRHLGFVLQHKVCGSVRVWGPEKRGLLPPRAGRDAHVVLSPDTPDNGRWSSRPHVWFPAETLHFPESSAASDLRWAGKSGNQSH